MAATKTTTLYYPITDTANDQVNTAVLKQQLVNAALSVTVGNVWLSGANVFIELLGLATSGDITAVDGVIAAHQGDSFATIPIYVSSEAESNDDTGSEIQKLELVSGVLPAGSYVLGWHIEHRMTSVTSTSICKAFLTMAKNGAAEGEISQNHNDLIVNTNFGSAFPFQVLDGETYTFRLKYQRVGASGNAARCRRARMSLLKAV